MLIIYDIFLRTYDVLESVLDIEGTKVGKTDVALALMELTMGEININPKRPSQLSQIGFPRKLPPRTDVSCDHHLWEGGRGSRME